MTAREIVDWVETRLRLLGIKPPGDGDILMIANEENERTARDLKIPRRYIKNVNPLLPFDLPAEALPGGALFAEQTVANRRIEVLTVAEANLMYPDWEKNATEGFTNFRQRLIIYDPANVSAPVYPVGFQAGDLLRIEYVMRVRKLVFSVVDAANESLEPWNGVLPEYHRAIPQLVTFQLAMMLGDELQAQKARAFYADGMKDMEAAFSYSRPNAYFPSLPWAGRY
jgi:hypothetical protein